MRESFEHMIIPDQAENPFYLLHLSLTAEP